MRFIAVILIAAVLLGAVAWCQYAFTRHVTVDITREAHGHAEVHDKPYSDLYRMEVTPSFDAGADPFALQVDDAPAAARLALRGPVGIILEHRADIRRGETITVDEVKLGGLQAEVYVEAVPSPDDAARPCAVRLRVFNDAGAECDDTTIWSEGDGHVVAGTVHVRLVPRLESVDRGLAGGEVDE